MKQLFFVLLLSIMPSRTNITFPLGCLYLNIWHLSQRNIPGTPLIFVQICFLDFFIVDNVPSIPTFHHQHRWVRLNRHVRLF